MPEASIVIPCYNAEAHLAETLAHALSQTVGDIEVICIDNGSTDGTRDILESHAACDQRIRIAEEREPGEGPARDAGLAIARGEWLYFLDSDDLPSPTLLEESIAAGRREGADVVVFRAESLDDQTGEVRPVRDCYLVDWLPDGATSFAPSEHPERLFNSFYNWVHNKLFRHGFVESRALRFQHIHRTADLLFTCRALSEASRIALLDRALYRYRTNNPRSAMRTSDSHPLDFYEAFLALRDALEEAGTWGLYRDSFVNWAMLGVYVNMRLANSFEGFEAIFDAMHGDGLGRLDIAGYPRDRAFSDPAWEFCDTIANRTVAEAAFLTAAADRFHRGNTETDLSRARLETASQREEIARLHGEIATRDEIIRELEDLHRGKCLEIEDILHSKTYRLGNAIAAPARMAGSLARGIVRSR